ncbi:MAG: hypothetical protein V7L23_13225 [Nostoc sp.]|uniref:hypothetical protein n=1 Tax=Nostoc sp. TaxID=1180 RepID=UPI002FEF93A8
MMPQATINQKAIAKSLEADGVFREFSSRVRFWKREDYPDGNATTKESVFQTKTSSKIP